jgi:hypothetical protein
MLTRAGVMAVSAAVVAMTLGCSPKPAATQATVNDKFYAVTPDAVTVKGSLMSGALTEIKVLERVEDGSGRIDQPARLTGKLVLTNVSKDQSVRLLGGKLLYIDMQGKPIPLEDKRTEPTLKAASSYGSQERLDPGQEASQSVEADFPAEALKMKRLKEIRLELLYSPSAYKQETMNFGVAIGGQ